MSLTSKLLTSTKRKNLPFAHTLLVSWYMVPGLLILGVPILLFTKEVPLRLWPDAYARVLLVLVPTWIGICLMALIYGRLRESGFHLALCSFLFGVSMPIIVIGGLSVTVWFIDGSPFEGAASPDGIKNLVFLYALFGSIGAFLYWALDREARKRDLAEDE